MQARIAAAAARSGRSPDAVTLVGVAAGPWLASWLAPYWALDMASTMAVVFVLAVVPLGILWRSLVGGQGRVRLLLLGLVAGALGGMLL